MPDLSRVSINFADIKYINKMKIKKLFETGDMDTLILMINWPRLTNKKEYTYLDICVLISCKTILFLSCLP